MMGLLPLTALADCNWSSTEKVAGKHSYSKDCHIEVGKLVKEQKQRVEQVAKLNKSLTLKDLAISKQSARIDLWRDTSYKLEDRLIKHDRYAKKNDWLLFGGGILTTILTGWAIGQVNK